MCTLSVVPRRGGFRAICNRDEQRTRPAALPPRSHHAGRQRATWPVDPLGGGTWIGVNDAGLVGCLLNRNQRPAVNRRPGGRPRVSRGTIVPWLLERSGLGHAVEAARDIAAEAFEPFTLVLLQRTELAVLQNVGADLTVRYEAPGQPLVFTSSSLGDSLVEAPRRELFDALVRSSRAALAGQSAFHRHQWPDRPEISVHMARADAMTVSRTVLDVTGRSASLRYSALTRS